MSKYDVRFNGGPSFNDPDPRKINHALADIDARLAKLEAEAQKPAHWAAADAARTEAQREPGWYPVWSKDEPSLWRWASIGVWVSWDGLVTRKGFPAPQFVIGPRIQPPEGAV